MRSKNHGRVIFQNQIVCKGRTFILQTLSACWNMPYQSAGFQALFYVSVGKFWGRVGDLYLNYLAVSPGLEITLKLARVLEILRE